MARLENESPQTLAVLALGALAPVLGCLSALAFVAYVVFFYVSAWCLPADAEF